MYNDLVTNILFSNDKNLLEAFGILHSEETRWDSCYAQGTGAIGSIG